MKEQPSKAWEKHKCMRITCLTDVRTQTESEQLLFQQDCVCPAYGSLSYCFRNRKQMQLHAKILLTNLSVLHHGCQVDAGNGKRVHGNNVYNLKKKTLKTVAVREVVGKQKKSCVKTALCFGFVHVSKFSAVLNAAIK